MGQLDVCLSSIEDHDWMVEIRLHGRFLLQHKLHHLHYPDWPIEVQYPWIILHGSGLKCSPTTTIYRLSDGKVEYMAGLPQFGWHGSIASTKPGRPPLYRCVDGTFSYWMCCGAASPYPLVTLEYRNNRYRVSTAHMLRPGLTDAALRQQAKRFKVTDKDSFDDCAKTWGVMVKLIYSGNMDQAWAFYDLAWCRSDKTSFLHAFKTHLRYELRRELIRAPAVQQRCASRCFASNVGYFRYRLLCERWLTNECRIDLLPNWISNSECFTHSSGRHNFPTEVSIRYDTTIK